MLDPWELTDTTPATVIALAPTPITPIFLLAPAKEITPTSSAPATPATIASKPPQPATDYNSVLIVPQLRKKAQQAGIKNSHKMRKNQLLAALASKAGVVRDS